MRSRSRIGMQGHADYFLEVPCLGFQFKSSDFWGVTRRLHDRI